MCYRDIYLEEPRKITNNLEFGSLCLGRDLNRTLQEYDRYPLSELAQVQG